VVEYPLEFKSGYEPCSNVCISPLMSAFVTLLVILEFSIINFQTGEGVGVIVGVIVGVTVGVSVTLF
jgi:hypothetical protein